jgi:3-phenylpropionate/trans-cinnamate dioxygenase ferredoxin subunit
VSRHRVAALSQLRENLPHPITVEDDEFVLIRVGERVFCLYDRCSHQDFPLSLGKVHGCTITCSAHGAQFDLASGKALTAPAFAPVETYPVTVEGDDVYVDLEY